MKALLISVLVLSAIMLAACGSVSDISGFYEGKIGEDLDVIVSLKQTGSDVSGYYHTNKNSKDIRISGKLDEHGNISIEEYGFFEVTGYWEGKISGDNISGEWRSGDKKRTLEFSLTKLSKSGTAGEPIGTEISFGAKEVEISSTDTEVPAELAANLLQEMIEYGILDPEYDKEVIEKGKTNPSILFGGKNIDLNNDGVPELIVSPSGSEGACISHNCPIWVFHREGKEFRQVLNGSAVIFGYMPLNFTSNGFHDVALIQHASAVEQEYGVFSFRNGKYEQTTCITATGREEEDGSISFSYKEHSCMDNMDDHEAFDIFIGYFKSFETGDYIHAVFTGEDNSTRSFWLPDDEAIYKELESNKGKKFEIHYVVKDEFIPEAGDTMSIEMIEAVTKLE